MSAEIEVGKCGCGCGATTRVANGRHRLFLNGHQSKGKHGRTPTNAAGPSVDIPCGRCGKIKSWMPSHLRRAAKLRFCSAECHYAWRREHPELLARITVVCPTCRKEFVAKPGAMNRRGRAYCSASCGTAMRKTLAIERGKANAVPGSYSHGRREALNRDGRACRICGFTLALNVHHITPRASGGTNDIGNVITLCPNHHAMVHAGAIKPATLLAILARPPRRVVADPMTLPGID